MLIFGGGCIVSGVGFGVGLGIGVGSGLVSATSSLGCGTLGAGWTMIHFLGFSPSLGVVGMGLRLVVLMIYVAGSFCLVLICSIATFLFSATMR